MRMENKIVLVTGAALGYKNGGPSIGSAMAFKLASEGAKVVVVDILEEMGQGTVDKISESGGEGLLVRTDVSKANRLKELYGKVFTTTIGDVSRKLPLFSV